MAYPKGPTISTSYTAKEQEIGDGSLPGQEMDIDFFDFQRADEEIIDFLRGIARADGKLANGIVTSSALGAGITLGFEPPLPWKTGKAYAIGDTVYQNNKFYLCVQEHTSTTFLADLNSGRWQMLIDFGQIAQDAEDSAQDAANSAQDVLDAVNNFGATATTLPFTASATAVYDPNTGIVTFGIPAPDLTPYTTSATLTGTSPSADVSTRDAYTLTTSGNTTITLTGAPAPPEIGSVTIIVKAGGVHTLSWAGNVKGPGDEIPDGPDNGETSIFTAMTVNGGTTWLLFLAGEGYAI